jgi:hypothetical protein
MRCRMPCLAAPPLLCLLLSGGETIQATSSIAFLTEDLQLARPNTISCDDMGPADGSGVLQDVTPTTIKLKNEADTQFTRLDVSCCDRPGLLVSIVKTLKDCNVNVLSAEVDTIGSMAQDEFMVTYHGEPLNKQMRTLVKNALQYYLALADIETVESY